MGKVLCFGEILLRMSPVLDGQWLRQASMPVYIGGAELNAAHALAMWGVPVKYFSAGPDNYLTRELIRAIEEKNIDASAFHFSGNRIGTYYLPQGADLKHAGVIYDRAHSPFAELNVEEVNWENVFRDVDWLHFSAICPALSPQAALLTKNVAQMAARKHIRISLDLNYRAKLWQYGTEPVDIMPELTRYASVVMGNLWAADTMLGISNPVAESKGRTIEELVSASRESITELHNRFPATQTIAYTFRLEDRYFAVLWDGQDFYISKTIQLDEVKDRVGSGDCFMAALIAGVWKKNTPQDIIDFAAAAAVNKLYETGDVTCSSERQVRKLLK